jgi:hypothetical protein
VTCAAQSLRPDSDRRDAFLSDLDTRLMDTIRPLGDHGAELYFPFFANTFPLAFHYASLLKRSNKSGRINDLIKLIAWDNERAVLMGTMSTNVSVPRLCYTTEEAIQKIGEASRRDAITQVPVTVFSPKWVFTEFNLKVWSVRCDSLKAKGSNQRDGVVRVVDVVPVLNEFELFEVYTEIPDQATAFFDVFAKKIGLTVKRRIIEMSKAEFLVDSEHLTKRSLKLFFYGGPLMSYFFRKRQRYIPLLVDEIVEPMPFFKTLVAVTNSSAEICKTIGECIRTYHLDLYKSAKQVSQTTCYSFRAMQHNYNRIARVLQTRSSFLSPLEYAQCLSQHHKEPT